MDIRNDSVNISSVAFKHISRSMSGLPDCPTAWSSPRKHLAVAYSSLCTPGTRNLDCIFFTFSKRIFFAFGLIYPSATDLGNG